MFLPQGCSGVVVPVFHRETPGGRKYNNYSNGGFFSFFWLVLNEYELQVRRKVCNKSGVINDGHERKKSMHEERVAFF